MKIRKKLSKWKDYSLTKKLKQWAKLKNLKLKIIKLEIPIKIK
jgi:hypothetical protein